jgi:hypothetical protein
VQLQRDVSDALPGESIPESTQKLGDAIAKAVADANSDESDCLTACQTKKLPLLKMEVF